MADELFQIRGDAPAVPDLKFWSVLGHESLSRSSHYELTVLSENKSIAAKDVLGYAFDVVVKFQDRSRGWHERHCQGHAVRFLRVRQVGRYFEYRITLRSWFWLLTKRRNSRILQDKPVLDVLDAVFEDSPIKRFKKTRADHVIDPHQPHRYCVQFEESDHDFLSRLLEEEGIYYWFDAHAAPGTMLLADVSSVAHDKLPAETTLDWISLDRGEARFNEISTWIAGKRLDTGKWAATDSNFKTIRKDLGVKLDVSAQHELPDFEAFEFPGDYFTSDDGDTVSRRRGDELQSRRERHWAVTGWSDVAAGRSFKYQGDPDASRNGEYIIASCTFVIGHPGYEGLGDGLAAPAASSTFDALLAGDGVSDGSQDVLRGIVESALEPKVGVRGARSFVLGLVTPPEPFRPPRVTPRKRMPGPQSAIVVGPKGEELHVDEFGRVKVHFHWDRYDESNEKSTCWVRVSQPWAGKGWGGYFAPRIGQEVIVDFLNGDPDRPIIMGRVYNDDQPIPYESPTQSGFKTRSTPGGSVANYNELRFEDKKDEEQVYLHAERNHDTVIEKRETRKVGTDSFTKVAGMMQLSTGKKRTADIGADDVLKVVANQSISIGGNWGTTVNGSSKFTSMGDWKSAAPNIEVYGTVSYRLSSIDITSIATAAYKIQAATYTLQAPAISVSGTTIEQNASGVQQVKAGAALNMGAAVVFVDAKGTLTLQCGGSSIMLTPAGITINAPMINATASGMVTILGAVVKTNA